MNTNCNTSLPDNAINVSDVAPGMQIHAAYGGERGTVAKVGMNFANRVLIKFTDGTSVRASLAGTFRYDNAPDGYSYHNGHGCIHDW